MTTDKKKARIFLGKIKRKLGQRLYLTRFLIFSLAILTIAGFASFFLPVSSKFLRRALGESVFLVSGSTESLKSAGGRVNLLVLGAGGAKHEGADLTDTLIFVSIDLEGKEVLVLSLPRDIWISSMRAKINAAYYYGEEKKPGGGLVLAKAAVAEILDQPVHYGLLVDFDGFTQAIDLLGGLEIEVERAFDDFKYPIPGMEDAEPEELRYEHLSFSGGSQIMSGDRALKYVRSRNSEGEEGTDFARLKRQQRLLSALRKKLFSAKTLLNLKKMEGLMGVLADHLDTDIEKEEYPAFFKLLTRLEKTSFRAEVLDGMNQGEEGFLINPDREEKYDYQWVLVPRIGNWQEVQEWAASLINSS
ncbi:MAG: LCP family protein [Candidatus Pacebacteria bacterium]|nr:LCP family protein [Candidatus Paceibacterota bacterium]